MRKSIAAIFLVVALMLAFAPVAAADDGSLLVSLWDAIVEILAPEPEVELPEEEDEGDSGPNMFPVNDPNG